MRTIPLFLLLALCGCAAQPVAKIAPAAAAPSVVAKPLPPAPPQVSMFADAFNAPLTASAEVPIAITPAGPITFPDIRILICGQSNVIFQGAVSPSGPWTNLVTNLVSIATNVATVLPKLGPTSCYRAFVF